MSDSSSIVILNTSKYIQSGFGGEDTAPRDILPTVDQPIRHGAIANWDAMEKLWGDVYNNLHADPTQYDVLLTESPCSTDADKMQIASIMFDKFNVPRMQLMYTATGTLYASGKTTGTVFESDDDLSIAISHYKGFAIRSTAVTIDATGRIHDAIFNSIMKSNLDLRCDLFKNIVLGSLPDISLLPAMAASVQKEIQALGKPDLIVKVSTVPNDRYTAFNGASILTALSSFQSSWVTAQEYNENGPSAVIKKRLN